MQIESQSTSGTIEGVTAEFPEMDIRMARMAVGRLVSIGERKGPSDLLVLSDAALDEWLTEEAKEFLRERKRERQGS